MINASLSDSAKQSMNFDTPYRLGDMDYEVLHRFQARTIWTLGTGATVPVYQRHTLPLACTVSFDLISDIFSTGVQKVRD